MTNLSVNINKLATLRNSRGKNRPNLLEYTRVILDQGITSITVHPRPDERHIKRADVYSLAQLLRSTPEAVEFNIEGYPSVDFIKLVKEVKPTQCTLVPDPPEALTSNAGWDVYAHFDALSKVRKDLGDEIRLSLFINPFDYLNREEQTAKHLRDIGTHRIELYTEAYADAFGSSEQDEVLAVYKNFAFICYEYGLDINAGHDLDLNNLPLLLKEIPCIAEVSIGHALMSDALLWGLPETIARYQQAVSSNQF